MMTIPAILVLGFSRSAEDAVLCRGSGCPRKNSFSLFRRRRRHKRTSYVVTKQDKEERKQPMLKYTKLVSEGRWPGIGNERKLQSKKRSILAMSYSIAMLRMQTSPLDSQGSTLDAGDMNV